jgi:hypothetical protein
LRRDLAQLPLRVGGTCKDLRLPGMMLLKWTQLCAEYYSCFYDKPRQLIFHELIQNTLLDNLRYGCALDDTRHFSERDAQHVKNIQI